MAAQLDTLTWAKRAIELAERNHTLTAYNERRGLWLVQSATSNTLYAIRAGHAPLPVCDCPAGQHGRPCKHAGAVLLALAEQPRDSPYDPDPSATAEAWC